MEQQILSRQIKVIGESGGWSDKAKKKIGHWGNYITLTAFEFDMLQYYKFKGSIQGEFLGPTYLKIYWEQNMQLATQLLENYNKYVN